MQLMLAPRFAFAPSLAAAFLGWPTGKPTVRMRRWILAWTVVWVVWFLAVGLFERAATPNGWPKNPLAPFTVVWVATVFSSAGLWLLAVPGALALMILLVRQRRGLPAAARQLVTPITVVGVVVAVAYVLPFVVGTIGPMPFDAATGRTNLYGAISTTLQASEVGLAAVGLLVAASFRRRAVARGERRLDVDVGSAAPVVAPTVALQMLLGDPTAQLLYPRPDGDWVDADGTPTGLGGPHRIITPVVDADGVALATIDTDARVGAYPSLIEVAAATLVVRLANERATALARARQNELGALQHAVLDATDAARRRLERDLHDGAQQRLVGLTLAVRLAARSSDRSGLPALRSEVGAAKEELLEAATPAVLAWGLAAALTTLAATASVPTKLHLNGDLDGADALARTVWFIANEAVANAVKHAHASALRIDLVVNPTTVTLHVADNGLGGVSAPPKAIAARTVDAHGTLSLQSPPGEGTEVTATFNRSRSEVAA
jgi:signal transduction histidine kinase